eukprot:365340-Chlamydomonas_euryale.AAC.1
MPWNQCLPTAAQAMDAGTGSCTLVVASTIDAEGETREAEGRQGGGRGECARLSMQAPCPPTHCQCTGQCPTLPH